MYKVLEIEGIIFLTFGIDLILKPFKFRREIFPLPKLKKSILNSESMPISLRRIIIELFPNSNFE